MGAGDGALVGALVGALFGFEVGDTVGRIVGLDVGQVWHVSLQTSFAGPIPSYQSVFLSQVLVILSSSFDASHSQLLKLGTPSFILWKNSSDGTSVHEVG